MKRDFPFSITPTFLIFLLLKWSFLFVQTLSIFPLYKIILIDNINKFKSETNLNRFYLESKGIGILFNNNSEVSSIPMNLFQEIVTFYRIADDYLIDKIEDIKNGYKQYLIIESTRPKETLHFILKDYGITFPLKHLFYSLEDEEDFVYYFRFVSKEDQENIIIGKDLIQLMNVTFTGNDNFIINNSEFISKLDNDKF